MNRQFVIKTTIIVAVIVLAYMGRITHSPFIKEMAVHFINVGYGQAVLVEFQNGEFILVDTGGEEYQKNLTDFLDQRGVKRLNAVLITHPHSDHYGNLPILLDRYQIDFVITNGAAESDRDFFVIMNEVYERDIPVFETWQNDTISCAPLPTKLAVLHPKRLSGDVNNDSLVLAVMYGSNSVLLFGDNDPNVQRSVILELPKLLKVESVDVVSVPHHGDKLGEDFIRFFKNSDYVLSVGKNKWGYPLPKTIEQLKALNGTLYRTDVNGNITVTLKESSYEIHTQK